MSFTHICTNTAIILNTPVFAFGIKDIAACPWVVRAPSEQ